MTQDEIFRGVVECIAESLVVDAATIQPTSSLISDLGADSLDFMDIMFSLERKFGVALQKEEFDLLAKTGMKKEEAIENGNLTAEARNRLLDWLPGIPADRPVPVRELGTFITAETIVRIVEGLLEKKVAVPAEAPAV